MENLKYGLDYYLETLKSNLNIKMGWLPSWNTETDPPTFMFIGDTILFRADYDEEKDVSIYARTSKNIVPKNLIYPF